jgi:hypothetical protein
MTNATRPALLVAAGAWWRVALALAWVAGVALQLFQAALWERAACPLMLAAVLGTLLGARRRA